ncbi:hypothetical protein Efla_002505 [Eimeria flavescens]
MAEPTRGDQEATLKAPRLVSRPDACHSLPAHFPAAFAEHMDIDTSPVRNIQDVLRHKNMSKMRLSEVFGERSLPQGMQTDSGQVLAKGRSSGWKLFLEPGPQMPQLTATQDVAAIGLNQVAEMEAVRTRGLPQTPNFTTHDQNVYHALGRAWEAAKKSTNAREGGIVCVGIAGTTVLALVDTGSAITLLDASIFTTDRLRKSKTCTRSEGELLLHASRNQIAMVGVWEAWVACLELAGCILVDVAKGLPTKAGFGLDSFRALMHCVVY